MEHVRLIAVWTFCALTLATAGLCGYRGEGHVKLAASVEFMHTATLLHDDVVDESDLRRGKAAARVWGCDLTENYIKENAYYTT